MSNNLLFDFNVDKAAQTVFITREFNAGLSLVWDAFTKSELLDQWGAPAPMRAKTKYMDFKVGGQRFYAMISPDGQERWSIQKYISITPKTNFKMFNAFADKDENLQLPGSIGITLLVSKTEKQKSILLFTMNPLPAWRN